MGYEIEIRILRVERNKYEKEMNRPSSNFKEASRKARDVSALPSQTIVTEA